MNQVANRPQGLTLSDQIIHVFKNRSKSVQIQALLLSLGCVLSNVPFELRSRAVQSIKGDIEKIAKILGDDGCDEPRSDVNT